MTNQPGVHGQSAHGGGMSAGAQMYDQKRPAGADPADDGADAAAFGTAAFPRPSRTYSADEIRRSKVVRGHAMADAANGNQSAKDALKAADAVIAPPAPFDPLQVTPPPAVTDLTPGTV